MPAVEGAQLERVSEEMMKVFQEKLPSQPEMAMRSDICRQLNHTITQEWPQARLQLFGSSGNNFCTTGSDLDLCLHVPTEVLHSAGGGSERGGNNRRTRQKDEQKRQLATFINRLGERLRRKGMLAVQTLPHARIPIVKFKYMAPNGEQIDCDMSINNTLACLNTDLLRTYTLLDWRLRPIVYCVKHWAKQRQIHDPYRGYLSSYTYTLLVIHCLQQLGVLPVLQSIGRRAAVEREDPALAVSGQYDCYFSRDVDTLQGLGEANNAASLGELFVNFFYYYAKEFDIKEMVASVRCGGPISKKSKNWEKPREKNRHVICIEDPFDIETDLGRYVDESTLKDIVEELERAFKLLSTEGAFAEVMSTFTPPAAASES